MVNRRIVAGSEEKSAVTRGAKSKTHYKFTLHTIYFYRKDKDPKLSEEYPDEGMGFFSKEIRDRAIELLKETEMRIN